MDAAYISALAALAGSAVGGLTSFATARSTQHTQARAQRLAESRTKREALYGQFIDEASLDRFFRELLPVSGRVGLPPGCRIIAQYGKRRKNVVKMLPALAKRNTSGGSLSGRYRSAWRRGIFRRPGRILEGVERYI